MKAVVVEIRDKDAAILTENGEFEIVKNKNYNIGEAIIMTEKKTKKLSKKLIVSIASAVAVVCFGCVGAYAYYTPAGYVSLDINPSIEYVVNTFDKVIDVNGVNQDGEKIVENIDVQGKEIDDAIDQTIDQLIETGYIANENSELVISANYGDNKDSEDLAQKLEDSAQAKLSEEGKKANIETFAIGKARVDEAKKLGVTPGKLNLVEKLKESSANPDEIVISDWLNKPVKQIQSEIKANKGIGNTNEDQNNEKEKANTSKTDSKNDEKKEVTKNQIKDSSKNEEHNSSQITKESSTDSTQVTSKSTEQTQNSIAEAKKNSKPDNSKSQTAKGRQ